MGKHENNKLTYILITCDFIRNIGEGFMYPSIIFSTESAPPIFCFAFHSKCAVLKLLSLLEK